MFKGATAFNIKEYNPFLNKIAKERKVDTLQLIYRWF